MILKYIFYISFSSLLFFNPSISEVRELYKKAVTSEEVADQFYNALENVKKTDNAVLVAYKAASLTIKGKYAEGAKNKKIYFKNGVTLLEYIINENPNLIELRVIRLSIQENAPKVLKYKKNMSEDASFIYQHLKEVKNKDKKAYISAYVLQSKSFSPEEKNVISEL